MTDEAEFALEDVDEAMDDGASEAPSSVSKVGSTGAARSKASGAGTRALSKSLSAGPPPAAGKAAGRGGTKVTKKHCSACMKGHPLMSFTYG